MSESPSPVIRRAARTYGKSRKSSDHDISFDTSFEADIDPDCSTRSGYDIPPSSDAPDCPNASPHREGSSGDNANDVSEDSDDNASHPYPYSWRHQLDDINSQYDSAAPTATTVLATQHETQGIQAPLAAFSSNRDQSTSHAFSGSRPLLSGSSPPKLLAQLSPLAPRCIDSSPIPRPVSNHAAHRPSTPQSPPRHPIGTPRSGSSPTPPTSIEAMPKKGKGKGRVIEPRRSNSDDEAAGSSRPSKSSRAGGKVKKVGARTKAPTKKEREEMQKTTARLVADQPVSLPRPEVSKQFTLTGLLSRVTLPKPEIPQIPSSDPIQSSSPPAERRELGPEPPEPSEAAPRDNIFVANGLLADAESQSEDEDLPDGLTLIKQKQAVAAETKRQQELREAKLRVLAQQQQQPMADDEESDLEIEDNQVSVLREEDQARRAEHARGMRPSKGRANQLAYASPNARQKVARFPTDDEQVQRLLEVSAASAFNPPSTKGAKLPKLSTRELNKLLLQRADRDKQQIDKAKQEDWKRRGGRLGEQLEAPVTAKSPAELLQEIIRQRQGQSNDAERVSDDDESDEWKPEGKGHGAEGSEDEEEGRQSPMLVDNDEQADDEDDDENPFLVPRMRRPGGHNRSRVVATLSDDEDDGENRPPNQSSLGSILALGSQIPPEGALPPDSAPPSLAFTHRNSVSSLGDITDGNRTEDGTDKENDVRLSFDRGEDKENTKVHSPLSAVPLRLGRSFSTLFADDAQMSSPSGSVRRGDVRSPLKELPKDADDDDPFGFTPGPPLRLGGPSGMASLEASPMPLDLGKGSGLGLEPAFSLKVKERARDDSPLGEVLDLGGGGFGGGGFSQFATQAGNARGFDQLKADNDDIDLTPEPGLQAVLDVSNTFLKKADEIFEKEQVALAEQGLASISDEAAPEMFVDANGFLTQTRPTVDESPMRFRSPLKTQITPGWRMSSASSSRSVFSSLRKPLAPILSQDPDEADVPARRRLHKRAVSTSPERALEPVPKLPSAFDILGKRTSPKRKRPARSEFVEGEAEESDDEAAFGFGAKKPDDDEEEDGEDQDKHLEDLVDDKEMDAETLAEAAVLEKVREHQEQDDKILEKVHVDAVKGVYRNRRRERGVGFEDDDSDEDDVRRPRPKRVRTDNGNIAALAKNKETQAFANEYSANMCDDENEFSHLKDNDNLMELDPAQPEEAQSDKEPGTVSYAQLFQELRQGAREREGADAFNPQDTSWMDRADGSDGEMEQEPRVREVSNQAVPARRQVAEVPVEGMGFSNGMDEVSRTRLTKWAKSETSSRTAAVVGRNTGGSAAVTALGKTKGGEGSFKAPRDSASSSSVTVVKPTKINKTASFLSKAVPNRRAKFGDSS